MSLWMYIFLSWTRNVFLVCLSNTYSHTERERIEKESLKHNAHFQHISSWHHTNLPEAWSSNPSTATIVASTHDPVAAHCVAMRSITGMETWWCSHPASHLTRLTHPEDNCVCVAARTGAVIITVVIEPNHSVAWSGGAVLISPAASPSSSPPDTHRCLLRGVAKARHSLAEDVGVVIPFKTA